MQSEPRIQASAQPWDALAQVYANSRQVSADRMIEWPAQLRMWRIFQAKHVLDVGCGTGDKARYFAEHGAASVVGVDPCRGFAQNWADHAASPTLSFSVGSFETLDTLPEVASRKYDLIVCFQALMYSANIAGTVMILRSLLVGRGDLVISVPHPFRFAILRNEIGDGDTTSLSANSTVSLSFALEGRCDSGARSAALLGLCQCHCSGWFAHRGG